MLKKLLAFLVVVGIISLTTGCPGDTAKDKDEVPAPASRQYANATVSARVREESRQQGRPVRYSRHIEHATMHGPDATSGSDSATAVIGVSFEGWDFRLWHL